jgi:hypothetical protein
MVTGGCERRVNGPVIIPSATEGAALPLVPAQRFSRRPAYETRPTVWIGLGRFSIRLPPRRQRLIWEAAGLLPKAGPDPPTSET